MRGIVQHVGDIAILVVLSTAQISQAMDTSTVISRWGHAAAYIPSPPTLVIQGGKTDPSSLYTYSSSPNTGETLLLPLDSGFASSYAPITSLETPSAPTSAWHTLSALSSSDGSWQLLYFGGDGGTSEPVQTGYDSSWISSINPSGPTASFTRQASGNGQPMRRIYHSDSSANGKVYISGGMKDDGSGATFSEVYIYDSSTTTFSSLPSLPIGLYHHSSMLLPNGTLLALGGAYTSPVTGGAALQSYSTIYSLDTSSSSPTWTAIHTSGNVPEGRRGASVVLNDDGNKAFLFGGADAALGEVYGDGWEFDLGNCAWKQVTTSDSSPGARYDHIAVGVGGNQVVIFGGYSDGKPADSFVHIWDISSNSWKSDFAPVISTSTSTTATSPGGKSPIISGASTLYIPGTKAISSSGSGTTVSSANVPSSSLSTSSTPTSMPTDAGAHSHPLTTPIRIGLILGILAFAAAILGLCLWRYKRKQKQRQSEVASSHWPSNGPRGRTPSRPYGSREKGGQGFMEDLATEKYIEGGYEVWGLREKGASIGLGMGAIGATLHSISSKFSGKKEDPYAELDDEQAEELGGPLRKSSRRIGDGIRLLGPRPQREKSLYYSPEKPVRQASIIRNSRIDMFRKEDEIQAGPSGRAEEEEDWVWDSDGSERNWKSAKSLLNRRSDEEDPFDDGPILPPLRGGPVPTPHESRSDLGTFDEIVSMSNPYSDLSRNSHSELSRNPYSDVSRNRLSTSSHDPSLEYHLPSLSPSDPLDLAGLLVPPGDGKRYSQSSMPVSARSGKSGQSNALSDAEEGIISEARYIHSQSPTLVSPSEVAYVPIKRSESFFRRMAAGGITSLLSSNKPTPPRKELDIRDPAPQPTLWPVISNDELNSSPISPNSNHPPTSWKADTLGLPSSQGKGPSLSSLNSARSMRDMVLIQREMSSSSVESQALIERSSPIHSRNVSETTVMRAEESDSLSPLPSEVSSLPARPNGAGHCRQPMGFETPGEIVFNGADFASPPILPINEFGPRLSPAPRFIDNDGGTGPHIQSVLPVTPTRDRFISLNTPSIDESSLPPSGSPIPSPLVQHRRPVKDVVNSINKRGGSTPFSLLSPMSNYSPMVDRKLSSDFTGSSNRPSSIAEDPFRSPETTPKPKEKRTILQDSPTLGRSLTPTVAIMGKRNLSGSGSGSGEKRPTTMWEVIKKEQLKVANPDQRKVGGKAEGSCSSSRG
ncbi:uncharacterized protein IL334_004811 [Kwoniella shivajii]|uniref:Galactose oxidase n=1 Tax=Kwoniella shivajii TaxID=564305 RepID=A0ABZ1D1D6_9TREE|nr:hypothetical protein IL334_004811 [Kwoniella shivajii]